MPAPTKAQLEPMVKGLMRQHSLTGDDAPHLAGAIAEVVATALGMLAQQATVAPGISCSPAASVAPGRLL